MGREDKFVADYVLPVSFILDSSKQHMKRILKELQEQLILPSSPIIEQLSPGINKHASIILEPGSAEDIKGSLSSWIN
jgi:hypothetical protein